MFSFNQMSQVARDVYVTCNTHEIWDRINYKPADCFFSRFDQNLSLDSPLLFYEVGNELAKLVRPEIEVIVGLEPSAIPIAGMLSQCMSLPAVTLRRTNGRFGILDCPEGLSLIGKQILIVDDVFTDGEIVLEAAQYLRSQGAIVGYALALLDLAGDACFRLFSNDVDPWSLFVKQDMSKCLDLIA